MNRDAFEYFDYLAPNAQNRFRDALEALGPDGHWIDMGAGIALPMRELLGDPGTRSRSLRMNRPPRMTAVGYSTNFSRSEVSQDEAAALQRFLQHADQERFRYLSGRLVENIPPMELGKADLISDFYGPLAYSTNISLVLRQYLNILNHGGSLYSAFSLRNLSIRDQFGRPVQIEEFLASIRGIDFVYNPISANLRITRTNDTLQVPDLTVIEIIDGVPPERRLRWHRSN